MFGCQGSDLFCTWVSVAEGYADVVAPTFMLGPSGTPQRTLPVEQISIVPELIVQLYVRVLE